MTISAAASLAQVRGALVCACCLESAYRPRTIGESDPERAASTQRIQETSFRELKPRARSSGRSLPRWIHPLVSATSVTTGVEGNPYRFPTNVASDLQAPSDWLPNILSFHERPLILTRVPL